MACALAQQRSDLDLGDELARRMMREAEQHGWNQERGHALSALGRAALMRWDLPRSLAYFLEAKEICVSEGEVDGELACLRGLAAATIYAGDLDEAEIWVGQMKERLRPEASALIHGGHHLMVATMAQARMRLPEAIDEMRHRLNKQALQRMKGDSEIPTEMLYVDINNQLEKIGNHALNIIETGHDMAPTA